MNKNQRKQRRLNDILQKQKNQVPQIQTNILNPNIAKQELIIFGFINLDLKRNKFVCNSGDGAKLLAILDNLKKHSGYDFDTVGMRKNCHFIPDDQITKHALHDIVQQSGVKRLFQLGSKSQPERIIGYFESNRTNIFQVCLLDLNHNLSGT